MDAQIQVNMNDYGRKIQEIIEIPAKIITKLDPVKFIQCN